MAAAGAGATNCQAPLSPSGGAAAEAPVFEFRFAPAGSQAQMPDAPSPTKNRLHGQAYGMRGQALIGEPDLTLRDELPITETGASLGGDFGRGATSYFVSLDRLGYNPENLLPFLTGMRRQTGAASLPLDANPAETALFTARIDRRFGARDSAYVRFNRDDLHDYSLSPAQGAQAGGLVTDFGVKQQSVVAGNTVAISPDTVNETSAQFGSSNLQLPANAAAVGVQSSLATVRRDRVFEAADNIYRQVGGKGVRMGGDFLVNQMNISFIESGAGRNSFFGQSDRSAGLYAESNKQVRPNFVLTSGIRYEIEGLPGFKTDTNNLAPQLGFSWAPSSSTVIRGGGGIYYDQIALPAIAGPGTAGGAANLEDSGRFVNRSGLTPGALADFTVSSPSMQNAYAEQGDVQVEQQIGARSSISAESQFIRGVQLALPVYRTASLCASTSACRAGNSFWGQEIGSGATSSYQGTSVAYTQEPVRWGSYKVSYTYATAQSMGTGENNSFIGDEMRRASITGVLHTSLDPGTDLWQHLAHGFMLTGTGDYSSRNEFAGMDFFNFNARLAKTLAWGQSYRLQLMAETFNMLERTDAAFASSSARLGNNAAAIYDTYQRVASFQSPIGSQAGLRLEF